MHMRLFWVLGLVASLTLWAGCAPTPRATPAAFPPTPTPVASAPSSETRAPASTVPPAPSATALLPSPTAAPSASLSEAELKYKLIERFGPIFFCDPDSYPVAHAVSDQEIARRVSELQKDAPTYQAILEHLGLEGLSGLSASQKRMVDAERKRLEAVQLQPAGASYTFELRTGEKGSGVAVEGTLSPVGDITVSQQKPSINTCPICLAGSSLIETPQGAVPVRSLRQGMEVWTVTRSGVREAGILLQVVRRPVPRGILLVHLVLNDGRELMASASHPTFDGRRIGDLAVGDSLDGARVAQQTLVPLDDDATYDLLPSGETGAYWANGILLGSTLEDGSWRGR